ncbi:MAG: hypothetical protein ACI9QD_001211 [Thermoproteota archaeon]|jgi:uncharacterized protein YhfF
MNNSDADIFSFWNKYLTTLEDTSSIRDEEFSVSLFGGQDLADDLSELILSGVKTAGSGLVRDYQMAGDELPLVGNHIIVLNAKSEPRCIIKITNVEINLYKNIDERIAKAEGEGDLSLEYWRKAHKEFFSPFLEQLDIEELESAEIVTEFFKVIHPLNS